MLIATEELLNRARSEHWAVGAFNVYHLEEVQAVIGAAVALRSPVILQMLPAAFERWAVF